MINVFDPLTPDQRRSHHASLRHYLSERDGAPDFTAGTLSRREERMSRFECAPGRVRDFDCARFLEQYARFERGRHGLTQEALLLMFLLRTNAAEAYGVARIFEDARRRAERHGDELELLVLMEETYHTRILLSCAPFYGLTLSSPHTPSWVQRGFLNGVAKAPDLVSRPLALVGEVLGVTMFSKVLLAAGKILAHDPELRDEIEARIIEVLVDEITHVSFNRIALGPIGMLHARMLLRPVSQGLMQIVPELRALGLTMTYGDDTSFATTTMRLPEAVRSAAYVA